MRNLDEVKKKMQFVAAKTAVDALTKDREELFKMVDNLFFLNENGILALPKTIELWNETKQFWKREFNVDLTSEYFTAQLANAEKRRTESHAKLLKVDENSGQPMKLMESSKTIEKAKRIALWMSFVLVYSTLAVGIWGWIVLTARYISWLSSRGGI